MFQEVGIANNPSSMAHRDDGPSSSHHKHHDRNHHRHHSNSTSNNRKQGTSSGTIVIQFKRFSEKINLIINFQVTPI